MYMLQLEKECFSISIFDVSLDIQLDEWMESFWKVPTTDFSSS